MSKIGSRTASDGDTEGGAPTVLVEAQACGLPIVATTHADIPFVCPTYRGLLATEGSVEAFAEKLIAIRAASETWSSLASQALEHVRRQHGLANVAALESLYDRVRKVGHRDG